MTSKLGRREWSRTTSRLDESYQGGHTGRLRRGQPFGSCRVIRSEDRRFDPRLRAARPDRAIGEGLTGRITHAIQPPVFRGGCRDLIELPDTRRSPPTAGVEPGRTGSR